jgi:hypothetical protein
VKTGAWIKMELDILDFSEIIILNVIPTIFCIFKTVDNDLEFYLNVYRNLGNNSSFFFQLEMDSPVL